MPGRTLNVLHLSTGDYDGGAFRAAFRLHKALQDIGIGSRMRVQRKSTDDPSISNDGGRLASLKDGCAALLDRLPLALYRSRSAAPYGVQWTGSCSASAVARTDADIIHLHWLGGGFLGIGALRRLGRPLVWTMHDMWPFTGGCHYDQGCGRYAARCGACPLLGSRRDYDLSRWVWSRKQRSWRGLPMALVAPSAWLAQCARSSSLFRDWPVRIIGNPLDTAVFRPIEKACARACLGIDQDRRVILFGGVNPVSFSNKGFGILLDSMQLARRSWTDMDYELIVFGCSKPEEALPEGVSIRFMGYLNDEISMAILYNAADVLVVPSFQESFCQTAAEALACGTPVVAFDSTGVRDVVDHKISGYLARPYEVEDLTHGMRWVLSAADRDELSRHARQKAVEHFSRQKIASEYARLYREVLDRDR